MNIASFDLNLLHAFEALLEERSVSRAATRVGLSQPAMSNALARLRDGVGDPLFERTRHGIAPTPRALSMAAPVRSAMVALQQALSGSTVASPLPRALSIAANSYAACVLLPAVARELADSPEPFRLDVRPPEAPASRDVALTLAWRGAASSLPDTRSAIVFRDSLVCIVRRGNRAVGDRFPLSTFLECAHVAVAAESGSVQDIVSAGLEKIGRSRPVALTVPDFVSAAWIVSQTDFVAVVPRRLAQSMAPRLGLGILKVPLDLPEIVLEVSWRRPAGGDEGAMWLKERILEAGRQLTKSPSE